jgi:hypothetical protein
MSASWVDNAKHPSFFSGVMNYFRGTCRSIILSKLKHLHIGSLVIREMGREVHDFGHRETGPSGELMVLDDAFWSRLLFYGPMVGEVYFHAVSIV